MRINFLLTIVFYLINTLAIAQDKTASICGLYQKEVTKAISIDVPNLLDDHSTRHLAFVDKQTGTFRCDFPIAATQEILFNSDRKLNLILSPGDSLFIKVNKDGTVEFSGTNSKVNEEILNYTLNKKNGNFTPNCEGKTLKEYKNELTAWTQEELKELQESESTNNYSKLFQRWAKSDILYRNASYLVDYAAYRQMNNLPMENELIDNQIFPVDNDQALVSLFYRTHLNQYLVFKYRFLDLILRKKENGESFKSIQSRLDSLLTVEKSTKSRDILVIDLFNMLLKRDLVNAINFINQNINAIQDENLKQLFVKRIEALKTTNRPITFLGEQNSDSKIIGNIFKDMAERFKGKVIYVDFWATWCGPCRNEFPYSISLSNLFSDKEVAFVYVCMDSEIEKWKSSVKSLKLNQNQYFLNEIESKAFRQKFQIPGFPTYYLIDKTGLLIDKDAPRPSSEEIKDKLEALLKS